jgi:hypothetical protein
MTQHRASSGAMALALVPIIALTVGIPIANHVEPRVLGLPFLLAYILIWIVLTPLFMLGVYTIEHRGEGKAGTKGAAR